MNSYFNHDEIEVKSVDESEPNYFRASINVPHNQVRSFLNQVLQAKNLDGPVQHEELHSSALLLMHVAWEEVAFRLKRSVCGHPVFDPDSSDRQIEPGKDFKFVLSGPLYMPPDLTDLSKIDVVSNPVNFSNQMIDQELDDQRLDLGKEILGNHSAQRGSTVTGSLTFTSNTGEVLFKHQGTVRLPLTGESCSFGPIILENAASTLIGSTAGEVSWTGLLPPNLRAGVDSSSGNFSLLITEINCFEPCSVEDVVSYYRVSGEHELRELIESNLKSRLNASNAKFREDDLFRKLATLCPKLPRPVYEQLERNAVESIPDYFQQIGVLEEDLSNYADGPLHQKAVDELISHSKSKIVLELAANQLEVFTSEDHLMQAIREKASQDSVRPEELRNNLIQNGTLDTFQAEVHSRRVLKAILKLIDES